MAKDTVCKKQTYTMRDLQYWEGGGIQESCNQPRANGATS